MKHISLRDLERRLEHHIYKEQLLLAIKGAILRFRPLAVILLGALTEEHPSYMGEAEMLLILEKKECPSSLKKRMGRMDEFGLLGLSFLDVPQFLKMVKDDEPFAREIVEEGAVIYTKDEGTWRYIFEMASIVGKFQRDKGVN